MVLSVEVAAFADRLAIVFPNCKKSAARARGEISQLLDSDARRIRILQSQILSSELDRY